MRWERGPLESGDYGENGVFAKMAEMALNRQNRETINKTQMRWESGRLQSGELGENSVFRENGRNGA